MNDALDPPRKSLPLSLRSLLFTLAVMTAVAGGYAYRNHQRYKHVAVHEPGRVYRAAWVENDVMTDLIKTNRIRTVVNLCDPGATGEHHWAVERETVRNAGARLLELPMPDTIDPTHPALAAHLEVLANPNNYPMLVHCRTGTVRTSKLLAIYDICFRGKSAADSLAAQPGFGRAGHEADLQAFCNEFERRHLDLYPQATASQLEAARH